MEVKNSKSLKKSMYFEKSGETISIEISIDNVSPVTKISDICYIAENLFKHLIDDLKFNNSSLQ